MNNKSQVMNHSLCLSKWFLILLLGIILFGCQSERSSSRPLKGEYIVRLDDDCFFNQKEMVGVKREVYPWEEDRLCCHPKITKNYFRCLGSALNPYRIVEKGKSVERLYDCGGFQKHSLPLKGNQEFVYPILIDLLNYIQTETGKRVVITCGHCCPEHNAYLSQTGVNTPSKHMIGAEVDFYVQGMEQRPLEVVDLIFRYYKECPKYEGKKEYSDFKRPEKSDQHAILPWMNKEVFIKVLNKDEGRDFDNRHPYPYICIQVRFDTELKQNVLYSWDKAFYNYHRW